MFKALKRRRILILSVLCVIVVWQLSIPSPLSANAKTDSARSNSFGYVKATHLNPQKLNDDLNLSEYLVSEKLDGIRGIWTGKALVTRNGNPIYAPKWFTKKLPKTRLDGELYTGRNEFERVSSIVLSHTPDARWQNVTYWIFDAPSSAPFSERVDVYQSIVADINEQHIQAVPQFRVASAVELDSWLYRLSEQGAEGLMLHHQAANFEAPKTHDLFKYKLAYERLATVIGHSEGQGRFQGMLGALIVTLEDGTEFKIGTGFSKAERQAPPKIGQQVVFRHHGFTKSGKPRFASFVAVKTD